MEERFKTILPDPSRLSTSTKLSRNSDGSPRPIQYYDWAFSWDTETFSFYDKCPTDTGTLVQVPRAVMWAWGFGSGEQVEIGRTWEEFLDLLDYLESWYGTSGERRIIIWVHNLQYDFSFLRRWVEWETVFSLEPRRVVYALTKTGIEFRCSYILTGYSLETVGKHLKRHTVKKLTGTVHFEVARHPETPLTETERAYLSNDCLVLTAHISECIEDEGGIAHIPLTSTGYVRRYVRKRCFRNERLKAKYDSTGIRYREMMGCLTMDSYIYASLRAAFQGGFTHSNPCWHGETISGVTSIDRASCYPAEILSKLYPMRSPVLVDTVTKEDFKELINNNCVVFTVTFTNIHAKYTYDHYISLWHCNVKGRHQEVNGRIVWADELTTTITNVDYWIIKNIYDWDHMQVFNIIKWTWGYLPKSIILSTLDLYENKTKLKGEPGKEAEYMNSKGLLNSIYGMMVFNPIRPEIPYDEIPGQWGFIDSDGRVRMQREITNIDKKLDDYNCDNNRFLYYAWGVFVTAYARYALWQGIIEFKDDYVYSDTDSLKVINYNNHVNWVTKYNNDITEMVIDCLKYYKIDITRAKPKTIKNIEKPIGVWEIEDGVTTKNGDIITYNRFKTLGAKRYMVEQLHGVPAFNITVSGVNKKKACPWILSQCEKWGKTGQCRDPFDLFSDGLDIPAGYSGKTTPHYIDEDTTGVLYDYRGIPYTYHERGGVHLSESPYSLGVGPTWALYLQYLVERGL